MAPAARVHHPGVNPLRTPRLLLAVAAAVLLGAGCSSTTTVDRDDLEKEVSTQLEKEVGTAPDDVECPDDLTGKKGETQRCTLTAGPDQVGLTVTVTGVDGTDVDFDIQVDDTVQDGAAEEDQ